MINRNELERLLAENNLSITVDKLLSEYCSKVEISVFIRPWAAQGLSKEKMKS